MLFCSDITVKPDIITEIEQDVTDLAKKLDFDFDLSELDISLEQNCFESDWEEKLISSYTSLDDASSEVSEPNEEESDLPKIDLKTSLSYIQQIKNLGMELGDNKLVDIMFQAKQKLTNMIVFDNSEAKSKRQTTLDEFL